MDLVKDYFKDPWKGHLVEFRDSFKDPFDVLSRDPQLLMNC